MNLELLRKYNFVTAWHLTDIGNLPSIVEHGLLARNVVTNQGIHANEVGSTEIVKTRKEWSDYALTFVTPYNKFIFNRPYWHHQQHPNSPGLCLLELDLILAVDLAEQEVKISSGLLSKTTFKPEVGPIDKFEDILDWHALLDKNEQKTESVLFARGAEVLFPNLISASCIRRVWIPGQSETHKFNELQTGLQAELGESLFKKSVLLPSPALHNFQKRRKSGPTLIFHKKFGRGEIVSQLGLRAVVEFEKFGTQLIRFSDYDWPDE